MESPAPDLTFRRSVLALALFGLLLVSVSAPGAAQTGDAPFALDRAQVDADAVLLAVDVQQDGDARWRVEYRVRLDDANTTAAFESLQDDVERNASAFIARFAERMSTTVADAAATTGRDMQVRNVTVTTTTQQLPQEYGVLVYTFEWTGFAAVNNDRLVAGDAVAGLFLDADSSLRLAWPEGYALDEVAPEPTATREQSVVWRGPTEFGTDEPRLVVTVAGSEGPGSTSVIGLVVVAGVLLGGGVLWWWRSRAGGSGTAPSGDATPADADTQETDDAPPEELLSNEERVIALLEAHGGRMKQQAVVEELGWTDAKTSQVVGKLRDAGDIEGFRLGRENVLRLPEVDDSPAPGDVVADEDDDG